jgi:hypothetical protein
MDYHCRTCKKIKKSIDFNHVVKICLNCCKDIVNVLNRLDKDVNDTGAAYIDMFSDLSESDDAILDKILKAYQDANAYAFPVQRKRVLDSLDARTERTILRGGELGEALDMWLRHKELVVLFQDIIFLSINIKPNPELDKWVSAYAKRTSR